MGHRTRLADVRQAVGRGLPPLKLWVFNELSREVRGELSAHRTFNCSPFQGGTGNE